MLPKRWLPVTAPPPPTARPTGMTLRIAFKGAAALVLAVACSPEASARNPTRVYTGAKRRRKEHRRSTTFHSREDR